MRSMIRIISLMLVCSAIAWAQSDRGSITGTVTDSTGGIVPDAAVTATNTATNVVSRTATNDTGVYAIPALLPGMYKVRVEKNGFKAAEQAQVVLAASSTVRVDVGLQVGEVSESVEVSSSLAQLQTDTSQDQYVCVQQDGGRASARGGWRDAKSFRLGLGVTGRQAGGRDRPGYGRGFCVGWRSGSRLGSDARRSFGGNRPFCFRPMGQRQHAFAGCDHRIHGGYERIQGRVWTGVRRHHEFHFEVGNERTSWHSVRVCSKQRIRCPALF